MTWKIAQDLRVESSYLETQMADKELRAVVKLGRIRRLVPGSVLVPAELNLLQFSDAQVLVDFFFLRRFGLRLAEEIQIELRAAEAIELRLAADFRNRAAAVWLLRRRRELAIENAPVAPSLVQKF